MDTRRYSYELPQGGMEIPCLLKFRGNNDIIQKVKKLLQKDKDEDTRSAIPIAEVPLKEPPAKIFKPSESRSMSSRAIFHAYGKANVWVRCHWGILSFNDKATLQNGD